MKYTYIQTKALKWYYLPMEIVTTFLTEHGVVEVLDLSDQAWISFEKKWNEYCINGLQPYQHKVSMLAKKTEPEPEPEPEQTKEETYPIAFFTDPVINKDDYWFRFYGQPVKVPASYMTLQNVMFLKMIEDNGWSWYENMKVNYGLTIPREFEDVINFHCMRAEVSR